MKYILYPLLLTLLSVLPASAHRRTKAPEPYGPVPSERQLAWHDLQFYAFICLSSATYRDVEWGYGDMDPDEFQPVAFNPRQWVEVVKAAGQDCRAGQPTPGNKAGGLSTLDEKSLGCIRKGGTRPIVEVLEQAQKPTKHGAVVMDTAGYDISSVTSMVAGGCQVVIFTTGRGTPTGNAIVPVLKVTANSRTYQRMEDNMDVDLAAIIRGEKTYKEMGAELLNTIHEVANGRLTKAEAYGFSDIAVDHVCRYV